MISLMLCATLGVSAASADAAAYQAALSAHVDGDGHVDYAALRRSGALDETLAELATAQEPDGAPVRMAFWINAYNALTLDLVADNFPLSSILALDGGKVWDTRSFVVAGRRVTLNEIEHGVLRPMGDPRIHAALNCASKGCPPLSNVAYSGPLLEGQLDRAARRWIRTNGVHIDRAAGRVEFSPIFDWYSADFDAGGAKGFGGLDEKHAAAANFVTPYLPEDDATWLRAGGWSAGWSTYDWSVNAQ